MRGILKMECAAACKWCAATYLQHSMPRQITHCSMPRHIMQCVAAHNVVFRGKLIYAHGSRAKRRTSNARGPKRCTPTAREPKRYIEGSRAETMCAHGSRAETALLSGELTLDALAALPRLTKDSFRGETYERAVSTTKEATEAQPRREAEESSSEEAATTAIQ